MLYGHNAVAALGVWSSVSVSVSFIPAVYGFAFAPHSDSLAPSSNGALHNPHNHALSHLNLSSKKDSWDFDENYDDDDNDKKDNNDDNDSFGAMMNPNAPNLGINIGSQLEPLTKEQAQELKDEASETINAAFDARMEEISQLKNQVRQDFESSKKAMRYASDLRAKEQTSKLMSKIDQLSNDFLDNNEALREGTKMAARADRSMAGKGLEVGSWGKLNGMNVLTASAGGSGMTVEGGLLGSVSAAEIDARQSQSSSESSIEVDTQVKGEEDNRIMVICDDKQDKNLKTVLERFESLLEDQFPSSSIAIDTYSPSSNIPMGGNNAKCCIIASTSLTNGQSSAEKLLGRVLKRTIAPGGGKVTKPPSHIVILSPLGTERIESFPYSMQNMMGGNKLKKAREVEEVAISTVKGRIVTDNGNGNAASVIPSLDYTIVKYGEIVEDGKIANKKDGVMNLQPGDSLDGKVGIEMAANVLLQSVALRPSARNATMSVIGAMEKDKNGGGLSEAEWEDWFVRLDGPELWRSDTIVIGDNEADMDRKFEELASYMNEWSDRFNNGAKGTGLTTPVTVSTSKFLGEDAVSSLKQRYGVRLEFKQTNTGAAYKSKSEERELERQRSPSASNAPPSKFKPLRQKKEGGIEIICEELSSSNSDDGDNGSTFELRVRARRCNMDDSTVVKELSEETILKRLSEAVEVWRKERV